MLYPWLQPHWEFFLQRLKQDRLAHAIMIEGPAGSGKNALACAMVAKLLCSADQPEACGQCRSCGLLKGGGAHPDRFELQPQEDSKVIKVDQVRHLIASLNLTTSISAKKVAYIHPADMMQTAPANALLKCLEEPNGDAVLILVSSDSSRLPVTIRSRCQSITVQQPDEKVVLEWLQLTCQATVDDAQKAVQAAGGSPLRALRYLDSTTIGSGPSESSSLAPTRLEDYTRVTDGLAAILAKPGSASIISNELTGINEDDVWRWLSMCTSEAVKSSMTGSAVSWWPADKKLNSKLLLALQKQADLNRRLSDSSVRSDLLLQDWLIRWAEQTF